MRPGRCPRPGRSTCQNRAGAKRPAPDIPQPDTTFAVLSATSAVLNATFPVLSATSAVLNATFPVLNATFAVLNATFPVLNAAFPVLNATSAESGRGPLAAGGGNRAAMWDRPRQIMDAPLTWARSGSHPAG